jgi:transcriptional regulator with XRE-family HTH domain
MADPLKEIGARVAEIRKARGLSQSDLAQKAGTTQPTISALESGSKPSGIDIFMGIARGLGMSLGELLAVEKSPPAAPHSIADCVRVVTEAALNRSPSPPLDSLDRRALAALAVDDPETKAWLVERLTRAAEVAAKPVGGKNSNGDEEESG